MTPSEPAVTRGAWLRAHGTTLAEVVAAYPGASLQEQTAQFNRNQPEDTRIDLDSFENRCKRLRISCTLMRFLVCTILTELINL